MNVVVTGDPADFAEHTGDFLTRQPIEHNVLATVMATLEPTDFTDAPVFAGYRRCHDAQEYLFCRGPRSGVRPA
ncbi:MAG: hypothetical protein MSC30_19995 [Gaiellaceae bacterium MAG52_C11]|nr:hypothetical protein [Candidatus Gaiellasilicea maunaloa]